MERNYQRTQDVPVFRAKPIIFTFTQAVTVNIAGNYVWSVNKERFAPDIAVEPTALYFMHTLTFAADISEADYQGAISVLPKFHVYTEKSGNTPDFRAPIPLPIYFQGLKYERGIYRRGAESNMGNEENRFLGSFEGNLIQTPSLVGKQNITLSVVISMQEINDQQFIMERGV